MMGATVFNVNVTPVIPLPFDGGLRAFDDRPLAGGDVFQALEKAVAPTSKPWKMVRWVLD